MSSSPSHVVFWTKVNRIHEILYFKNKVSKAQRMKKWEFEKIAKIYFHFSSLWLCSYLMTFSHLFLGQEWWDKCGRTFLLPHLLSYLTIILHLLSYLTIIPHLLSYLFIDTATKFALKELMILRFRIPYIKSVVQTIWSAGYLLWPAPSKSQADWGSQGG